jgi:hypothetical protein
MNGQSTNISTGENQRTDDEAVRGHDYI